MIVIKKKEIEEIAARLNKRLRRYGYEIPENCGEIEIHGPHPQMNYQVYVVRIVSLTHPRKDWGEVAIYPRGLFWCQDYSWNEAPSHKEETQLFPV